MTRKVIVTEGIGFTGAHLAEELARRATTPSLLMILFAESKGSGIFNVTVERVLR